MDELKVGVTGAAGYTGSRVTKRLLEKDHEVVALDNMYHGQVEEINGQEILDVDIREKESLEDKLADVDVIIHLAALSGLDDCNEKPDEAFEVNVEGTNNIVRICDKYSIPLIHSSSMAVIGDPVEQPITSSHPVKPLNLYGKTKAVNESVIRNFSRDSFPSHIFLKSNLYGNHYIDGQRIGKNTVINYFLTQASKGEPLTVYKPGTQSRDFIHVKDAAEAYVKSAETIVNQENGSKKFTVASGTSTSVIDVAEKIQKIFREEKETEPEIKLVENPRENETITENFNVGTERAKEIIAFDASKTIEDSIREEIKKL